MIPQAITISNDELCIDTQYFVHKDFSFTGKELLLDLFSTYYRQQPIRIRVSDGENVEFSGFVDFIKFVCTQFNIDTKLVIWETFDNEFDEQFKKDILTPGIFISVNKYIPEFEKELHNPKFVGLALGRFNPTRLRLAYQIDQVFPADNFTIFQPNINEAINQYRHVTDIYKQELDWAANKIFDKDITSPHLSGVVKWQDSCITYPNIWGKYQIEIISETDPFNNFWFTEKTARCLATGKPFVLVSGQGSLKKLRNMGFSTFSDVIDESYDNEYIPTNRIKKLISSLQMLYNSINRHEKILEMIQIANQNIDIYKKTIQYP
jgi:hypothetical protein